MDKELTAVSMQSEQWSNLSDLATKGSAHYVPLNALDDTLNKKINPILQVFLVVDEVLITYNASLAPQWWSRGANGSFVMPIADTRLSSPLLSSSMEEPWFISVNDTGWLRLDYQANDDQRNFHFINATDDSKFRSLNRNASAALQVREAIALVPQVTPEWYLRRKLSLSIPLIIIVMVSNVTKLAVFITILLDGAMEPPLVTIGDAIASFVTKPDPGTAPYPNFSWDDYIYKTCDADLKTRIDVARISKPGPVSTPGVLQPNIRRYGIKIDRHSILHKNGMMYL